jgi:predicted GNAT family N-acyltransferase
MPAYAVYQQADFPTVLKWQAIAFMRVEWPFIFTGPGKFTAETYPPALHPVHFTATEGDALLSYAATLRLNLEHADQMYTSYGFGNMFTFPPYRHEGYGQQVLTLATDFIQQSDVDIAVLFCDPKLQQFYAGSGWQVVRTPIRIGTPSEYETHDVTPMMLFVSEKGQQGKENFERQPLYIEAPW